MTVFLIWTRLIRPDLPTESRIRCLWLAFAGVAMLMSSTGVYFLSEVRSGFGDIGQGAFGLWFKFIAENVPFIILPALVLYSIYLQIDYLTRQAAGRDPLRDDVALDLRGSAGDGAREAAEVAREPARGELSRAIGVVGCSQRRVT